MSEFVPLNVQGARHVINRLGEIRQTHKADGTELQEPRLREPSVHPGTGYRTVNFRNDGKTVQHSVHRLVASTFIPNPEGFRLVRFHDDDPGNCRVDNLYWADAPAYAPRLSRRKLSDEQVEEIRLRLRDGDPQMVIAKDYGVDNTLISHIKAGRKRSCSPSEL